MSQRRTAFLCPGLTTLYRRRAKWFSTLDLKNGYWQVDVHPDDEETNAFLTGQGLCQFPVILFGFCNAPATIERLMETAIRGLPYDSCLLYLDDVIVIGRTFQEHLLNLRKIYQQCGETRLQLNLEKCQPLPEGSTVHRAYSVTWGNIYRTQIIQNCAGVANNKE
jgi:hypothetical protein